MNFSCNRTTIVESLSNVQRAVSAKSNIASLEGILIIAKENSVELCGYDLELGMKTAILANVEERGEIIANARLLTDIIRKLPEEIVTIKTDKNLKIRITCGQSDFSLIGINSKEFPELPEVDNPNNIELNASLMKSMIKQTLFATAETDSKPIHTGTLFDIKNKKVSLVSVDGYRLALRQESICQDIDLKFVVPGKTLSEIIRLLPDEEDKKMKVLVGLRHIIFTVEKYHVISRLLEGEFLDYEATIPEFSTTNALVNTRSFIESIERVSLMITDRLKSPVRCNLSDNLIKLSCNTSIGNAFDEISINQTGDNLEIGFNNKYMLDALKNSDTDEVRIQMNGPLSPIKILPKEGDSFLFLVLPVRLKSE